MSHAHTLTLDEIRELFPEPEFVEAAGVLEMIRQTPGQLHEYAARLKLRLDGDARIIYAREEGREEGKLLGRILMLQEMLSVSTPTQDELASLDFAQLNAVCESLKQQLRDRGQ